MKILAVILILALTAFNIIKSSGKLKKILKIGNAVMYGIMGLLLILYFSENAKYEKANREYKVINSGLFSSVTYRGTHDGYHILHRSAFLSSGDNIAVPDTVKLPLVTRVYKTVNLYMEEDSVINYSDDKKIKLGSEYCYPVDGVVKIVPNYFEFIMTVGVFDVIFIVGVNIIGLVFVLVPIVKSRKKTE